MGGGTGTERLLLLHVLQKEMGLLTVGVATLPSVTKEKTFCKERTVSEMQQYTDSMLIIDNQKLYKVYGDLPIFEGPANGRYSEYGRKRYLEIITKPGFMNVDFADVKW